MLTLLMIDLEKNELASNDEIEKIAFEAFKLLEEENRLRTYQTMLVEVAPDKDIKVKKVEKAEELILHSKKEKKAQLPVARNNTDLYTKHKQGFDKKINYEHLTMIIYENSSAFLASMEDSLYIFEPSTGAYASISLGSDKFTNFLYRYCPIPVRTQLNQSMEYKIYQVLLVACQNNGMVFTKEHIVYTKNHYLLLANCVYEINSGAIFGFAPNIPFTSRGLNIQLKEIDSYIKPNMQKDVFSGFLEDISNHSEQIKYLFRTFLGFIFANHEYNPKKIVILYGDKNTIRAIIKFLEYCIYKENIAHIPLEKLENKYAIREIENKAINISPYVDSKKLIAELDFILSEFAGEYIYAGNKAIESTILNDKCFLFSTDSSLNITSLLETVDSIDNILLIPISKVVEKTSNIDSKTKELVCLADYIFLDSMKARREIEDNDWEFEQLNEITTAVTALEESEVENITDEIQAFNDYLKERCDFSVDLMVIKRELKADIKKYCEKSNRKIFSKDVINQGVKGVVCRELSISVTEYDKEYEGGYGKNMLINGKYDRGFRGFGLKENVSEM